MTTRQNDARTERDANRLLADQIGDDFPEPHMERPPLEVDRGAMWGMFFAGALLVAFWVGIAVLLRSCS